jgi:hypothetical protein
MHELKLVSWIISVNNPHQSLIQIIAAAAASLDASNTKK